MKSNRVSIACGTALAVMAGAGAAHWHSIREMQALAGLVPAAPSSAIAEVPAMLGDKSAREAQTALAGTTEPIEKLQPTAPQEAAAPQPTDQRIEKLLTLLESTVEENQQLRDRIGETSRDLLELRFQVDSYDGQFRPLKVDAEPSLYDDGGTGVLPPLESP